MYNCVAALEAIIFAGIAQSVEHQLPKLRVASSSLVARSRKYQVMEGVRDDALFIFVNIWDFGHNLATNVFLRPHRSHKTTHNHSLPSEPVIAVR